MNTWDYPVGADTSDAPWNQSDPDPVQVDVVVSNTLHKSTSIYTCNYNAEPDGDGGTDYDFSECNLAEEFENSDQMSAAQTLEAAATFIQKLLDSHAIDCHFALTKKAKELLDSCLGWEEDELEIIKD